VYVANLNSNNVTAIDSLDIATTVTVGKNPTAIAVNPVTNKVYVANFDDNTVSIIDDSTLGVTTVSLGIPANEVGDYYPAISTIAPHAVAIDSVRNKIYIANIGSRNVTVIDEANNNRMFIMKSTAYFPTTIAVNTTTGEIFTVNGMKDFEYKSNGSVMRSFPVTKTSHK
jgi:YVTN family beta-propeller protein